ncbi:hypothetical protein ACLB9X_17580 [Streptomyces sp. 5K101]|uniref:hypothetical protein n=1 Tax=Streptomyces sp. 5K101 TaxID=3390037 RepID=UPI003974AC60
MTSETGLRTVLTDTARDITPSPVPLASIERAARVRRRRRAVGAAAVGAALVLAPLTFVAVGRISPPDRVVVPPAVSSPPVSPSPSPSATRSPLRVVASGERVRVAPGVELWLTPEGKHWTQSDGIENFRSIVDGNLDTAIPGVSMQSEGSPERLVLSGLYYGTPDAARVEIRTASGSLTASLLTLKGRPSWGVWYAVVNGPGMSGPDYVRAIRLYDSAGRVVVDQSMS